MGGLEGPPKPPKRSVAPGKAVALLDVPTRLLSPAVLDTDTDRSIQRPMEQHHHEHGGHRENSAVGMRAGEHGSHARASGTSVNRTALSATVHCLTGCAIGEVLGMVFGTAFGLGNWTTVVLSVGLAFIFGYSLTMLPLVRDGLGVKTAAALAFASDTASIALMEVIDNLIMVFVPGAMDAGVTTPLFWGSLVASLVIAGVFAFPLNRWLIGRGMGHAVIHAHHR
jgi:uncharacterized protein DUF4396